MNETSNSTQPYAARHEAADLVIAHDAMVGHALEVNGSTTLHGDVHVGTTKSSCSTTPSSCSLVGMGVVQV